MYIEKLFWMVTPLKYTNDVKRFYSVIFRWTFSGILWPPPACDGGLYIWLCNVRTSKIIGKSRRRLTSCTLVRTPIITGKSRYSDKQLNNTCAGEFNEQGLSRRVDTLPLEDSGGSRIDTTKSVSLRSRRRSTPVFFIRNQYLRN